MIGVPKLQSITDMEFIIKDNDIINQVWKAIRLCGDARESIGHHAKPVFIIIHPSLFNKFYREYRSNYRPGILRSTPQGDDYIFDIYVMKETFITINEIVII